MLLYKEHKLRNEYLTVSNAIKKAGGNKTEAAKQLGIDRKTLYNILTRYKNFRAMSG